MPYFIGFVIPGRTHLRHCISWIYDAFYHSTLIEGIFFVQSFLHLILINQSLRFLLHFFLHFSKYIWVNEERSSGWIIIWIVIFHLNFTRHSHQFQAVTATFFSTKAWLTSHFPVIMSCQILEITVIWKVNTGSLSAVCSQYDRTLESYLILFDQLLKIHS